MSEYVEVKAVELNDRKVFIVSDSYDDSIGMYYDNPFYYDDSLIENVNKLFCYMLVSHNEKFVKELVDDVLQGICINLFNYTHYQWYVDRLEVRENDNKTLNIKIYNSGSKKVKPSVREFIYSGSYSIELITENDNV